MTIEQRVCDSTGRPREFSKKVDEYLSAQMQRLRAENNYLKNLQALVLEDERRQCKKTQVVQKLRQKHALKILFQSLQLARETFCYHLKQMNKSDKYKLVKG